MNWSTGIRQTHRWTSIAFTATVLANFVALFARPGQQPPAWVTFSPLAPLTLLLITGLYLFVLPYTPKWRRARLAGPSQTTGAR